MYLFLRLKKRKTKQQVVFMSTERYFTGFSIIVRYFPSVVKNFIVSSWWDEGRGITIKTTLF